MEQTIRSFLAGVVVVGGLGAMIAPVASAQGEGRERCEDKFNKCTTRAENALEACESACEKKGDDACRQCEESYSLAVKQCENALEQCLGD